MILDEIRTGDNRYDYRFHLNRRAGSCFTSNEVISGRVIEKGEDWVRVRRSSDAQGAHEDKIIALGCICYVTEVFSRE